MKKNPPTLRRAIPLLLFLVPLASGARPIDDSNFNLKHSFPVDVTLEDEGILLEWRPGLTESQLVPPQAKTLILRREAGPGKPRWEDATVLIDPAEDDLPPDQNFFLDTTAQPGIRYEYQISAATPQNDSTSMVFSAAKEGGLIDHMGRIILVVEEGLLEPLALELERLEMDLVGDGWEVVRLSHERDPGIDQPRDVASQEGLRAKILAAYNEAPGDTTNLLLVGRLPIVFSGNINPDGHGSRAHMTDQFYGDMDGVWTDNAELKSGNGTTDNVAGDGKYDHNNIPGDGLAELQVGRIDFADLAGAAEVGKTELGMTRNYLRKDHVFRHGLVPVNNAFVDSGWQYSDFERGQALLHLDEEVDARFHEVDEMGLGPFLLGIGHMNNGSHATREFPIVFMQNHKSYVQELWKESNAHRGFVASDHYSLGVVLGGWSPWSYHPMFLGATMGDTIRDSFPYDHSPWNSWPSASSTKFVNDQPPWGGGAEIYLNLVGDPTLRMYPVPKPEAITLERTGEGNVLSWEDPSTTDIIGYHVYRASQRRGPYQRLTTEPITETRFVDASLDGQTYMVRTVKLNRVKTGTFQAASQGAFAEIAEDGTIQRAPIARDLTPTTPVPWDETRTVLLDFEDPDGDELLVELARPAQNGTASLSGGQIVYTPDPGYEGPEILSYTVWDGLTSADGTITLTVAEGPIAPTALARDEPVVARQPYDQRIRLDATDPNPGDSLDYLLVDPPANGSVAITGNVATYSPDPRFTGTDSFTWKANDGSLDSNVQTVEILVEPRLEPFGQIYWPFDEGSGDLAENALGANNDVNLVGRSTRPSWETNGILGSALRFDGTQSQRAPVSDFVMDQRGAYGAFSFSFWIKTTDPGSSGIAGGVGHVEVGINLKNQGNAGKISFGTVDSTGTAKILHSWSRIDDGEWHHVVCVYDAFQTVDKRIYIDGVLSGESDQHPSDLRLGAGATRYTALGGRSQMEQYNDNNISSFFTGTLDDFRIYERALAPGDVSRLKDTSTIASNRLPNAGAQTVATDEDTPVAITLAGDDPDGDPVTYHIRDYPSHGRISGTPPDLVYTPDANFSGDDSFTYVTDDVLGHSPPATVDISVAFQEDDAPVAEDRIVTAESGLIEAFVLTGNDPDGTPVTDYRITEQPAHGTLGGNPPDLTYTPDPGFTGTDRLGFEVDSGGETSEPGFITFEVVPRTNRFGAHWRLDETGGTTVADDSGNGNDGTLGGDPSWTADGRLDGALDFDGDGDYVAIDGLFFNQVGAIAQVSVSFWIKTTQTSSAGIVDWDRNEYFSLGLNFPQINGGDGRISWSTTGSTTGQADMLSERTVNDGEWHHVVCIFDTNAEFEKKIYIDGILDSEVDQHNVGEFLGTGTTRYGFLGDGSEAGSFDGGRNGRGFSGTLDDIRIIDTVLASGQIEALAAGDPLPGANHPPVAESQEVEVPVNSPHGITLAASDPDGDTLTYSITTGPTHGSLSGTPPSVTYTPDADYNGPDLFGFIAHDGSVDSNEAAVSIMVSRGAEGFTGFMARYSGQPPAMRTPEADMDGDGVSNLGEYLGGTRPDDPGSRPNVRVIIVTENGKAYPAIQFDRLKTDPAARFRGQVSATGSLDPSAFDTIAGIEVEVSPSPLGGAYERVTYRSNQSLADTPVQFFRGWFSQDPE